jgi:hypothetical protein
MTMPKKSRGGSTKPGEMCSYDPKTGLYTDRWLWEEILGEDFSTPPPPPGTKIVLPESYDPSEPPPILDDPKE